MPLHKIRYLIRRKQKNHWLYYWYPLPYLKQGFQPVQLGKDEAEAIARAAELNRALDDWRKKGTRTSVIGTVGWLIEQYKKDSRYQNLAPRSQKNNDMYLALLFDKFGDVPCRNVTRMLARAFYHSYSAQVRKAEMIVAAARVVFNFGKDIGQIENNPFEQLRVKKAPAREQIWTNEQFDAAIKAADDMGLSSMSLALCLGLYTAQRAGDLRTLTWNRYDGRSIRLRQSKTGAWVEVPVMSRLKERLDAVENRESPVILISEVTKKPYTQDYLSDQVRVVMDKAGLPKDLQFRDLRRTAVVRLAEAGCTVPEISAITGHSVEETTRILEVYLPRTSGMAENAIAKLTKLKGGEAGLKE